MVTLESHNQLPTLQSSEAFYAPSFDVLDAAPALLPLWPTGVLGAIASAGVIGASLFGYKRGGDSAMSGAAYGAGASLVASLIAVGIGMATNR